MVYDVQHNFMGVATTITNHDTIIHPNMLIVFKELSNYHPIYEPTPSSILPPHVRDSVTNQGSHFLFEVRAKFERDLSDDEIDRIEIGIQDIINHKLKIHQLVNLDAEWIVDGKGNAHPKLMVDSVIVAQDNLQVYVALASENDLNYQLANPSRSKTRRPLFDDLFNNL